MRATLATTAVVLLFVLPILAAETADELLAKARKALDAGKPAEAIELAGKAIEAEPRRATLYVFRGALFEQQKEHEKAVADFSRAIELDPKFADAYDHRGSEQFKLGHIKESLADFDQFLKLKPDEKPGHWKRGITLYYAGEFEEGKKQFEGYEKVDTNDVENAVWHFLCAARLDGVEKARASLLKIGKDKRVPMMEVYDLYAGKIKPADVLTAAKAGDPPAEQLKSRLFYAHLYLGLYAEATGDNKAALENMTLAADKYRIGHYMGDVAAVHRDILKKAAKSD